jgi:hypothetical protein
MLSCIREPKSVQGICASVYLRAYYCRALPFSSGYQTRSGGCDGVRDFDVERSSPFARRTATRGDVLRLYGIRATMLTMPSVIQPTRGSHLRERLLAARRMWQQRQAFRRHVLDRSLAARCQVTRVVARAVRSHSRSPRGARLRTVQRARSPGRPADPEPHVQSTFAWGRG